MALTPESIERARPFSLLEEKRIEDEYEKLSERTDFLTATKAAFKEDNAMSWVATQLEEYEIDPDFELTDENYDELTKDIPLEYRDFVEDARSLSHGKKLAERVKLSLQNEETLAKYGWKGTLLRIGAATIDPVAIGATVLSEGVLAPAIWGTKATRLQRAFRTGLTAGATSAGIEAYLVSQNEIKDPYDILYAAAGGLILGGATGSIFGAKSTQNYENAAARTMNDANSAQVSDVAQGMQDQGIRGVGAAENPMSPPIQIDELRRGSEDIIEDAQGAAFADFGKARFDMIGQLKSSKIGTVRALADILAEDAVSGGQFTADLIKTTDTKATSSRFYRVYESSFKSWAKDNGKNWIAQNYGTSRKDFGRLVADEVELPGSTTNQGVIDAANAFRKEMLTMLKKAKNANLRGFDDIPENPTYFAHLWDAKKFREIRSKYGSQAVPKLLAQGLLRANPDMSRELAEKIGKNMAENIVKRDMGMDSGLSRLFSTSNSCLLYTSPSPRD